MRDYKRLYEDCLEHMAHMNRDRNALRAALAATEVGECPHEHRDWDTTDGVRCVKCGATHLAAALSPKETP